MGTPSAAQRNAPADRAGTPVPSASACSRGRPADRRRPDPAQGGATMTAVLIVVIVLLIAALARARRAPSARAQRRPVHVPGGDAPDPVPVRRLGAVRASPRRRTAPGPSRGRDARPGLPRPRPAPSPARRSASAPVRRSPSRCRRRSSSVRRSSTSRSTRGSSGAGPTATHCVSWSLRSASTGSSSPPPRTAATASIPTTSPGCWTTPRARSSCCGRATRISSSPRRSGGRAGSRRPLAGRALTPRSVSWPWASRE